MSFLALVHWDQLDSHVARALADAGGPPERARPVALDRRALVHVDPADLELVGDELVVVLRVGDRRVEKLQHVPGGRPWGVDEYGTGIVHRLAADVVDHETRFAGSGAHVLRPGPHHHRPVRGPPWSRLGLACGGHLGPPPLRPAALVLRRRRLVGRGLGGLGLGLLVGLLLLGLLGLGLGRLILRLLGLRLALGALLLVGLGLGVRALAPAAAALRLVLLLAGVCGLGMLLGPLLAQLRLRPGGVLVLLRLGGARGGAAPE